MGGYLQQFTLLRVTPKGTDSPFTQLKWYRELAASVRRAATATIGHEPTLQNYRLTKGTR